MDRHSSPPGGNNFPPANNPFAQSITSRQLELPLVKTVVKRIFQMIALAAVAIAGCSKPPTTFKVVGAITYLGQPLTTGLVAFHHTDGKSPLVKGNIGSDGRFTLTTKRPGDGAAPGDYMITVTSMTPGHGIEGIDKDYQPPKPLIPLKYMRLDETPLKATVQPQDNVIDLALVR